VEGFILRAHQDIPRKIARAVVLATLIASIAIAPAFADVSPLVSGAVVSTPADDRNIQLAQADLPAIGGVNDYMHQDGDGPSSSAVPPQGYSPQAAPQQNFYPQGPQSYYPQAPQGYYPHGVPSQEWNNGYTDPNSTRNALIGAAVVGALAVGLWAYQQHEIHQAQVQQAQQPVRRRFHPQHRPSNNQIE
jgi:hypothetical protein